MKRNELIGRGEHLLARLQKENRAARRLYKVKEVDPVKIVARLTEAYNQLLLRVANDSMLLASDNSLLIGLTNEEIKHRNNLKKDIQELNAIIKNLRENAILLLDNVQSQHNGMGAFDEKQSHIDAALAALEDLGTDDTLTEIVGEVCEPLTIDN